MIVTTGDFWLERLSEAVEKALAARTEQTRAAYLDLARHYRSMYKRTGGAAAEEPGQGPVAVQLTQTRSSDFGSVHDQLMAA